MNYFLSYLDPAYKSSVVSQDLLREDTESAERTKYEVRVPFKLEYKCDIIWWIVKLETAANHALDVDTKNYIWEYFKDPETAGAIFARHDSRTKKAIKNNAQKFIAIITTENFILKNVITEKEPVKTLPLFRKWLVEKGTKFNNGDLREAITRWSSQYEKCKDPKLYHSVADISLFIASHTFDNDITILLLREGNLGANKKQEVINGQLKLRKDEVLDVFNNCFHYREKEYELPTAGSLVTSIDQREVLKDAIDIDDDDNDRANYHLTNEEKIIEFVWDSGSPIHIISDLTLLYDFEKRSTTVSGLGGGTEISPGFGKMDVRTIYGKSTTLDEVYYLPNSTNIISGQRSLPWIYDQDIQMLFDRKLRVLSSRIPDKPHHIYVALKCKIQSQDQTDLRHLIMISESDMRQAFRTYQVNLRGYDWLSKLDYNAKDLAIHLMLGHPSYQQYNKIRDLHNNSDPPPKDPLPTIALDIRKYCRSCRIRTMTKSQAPRKGKGIGRANVTQPLQVIHVDLAGPIEPKGHNGEEYFVVAVDRYSGMIYVEVIIHKRYARKGLLQIMQRMQIDFPAHKVLEIRADNGNEFQSLRDETGETDIIVRDNIPIHTTTSTKPFVNQLIERHCDPARTLIHIQNRPYEYPSRYQSGTKKTKEPPELTKVDDPHLQPYLKLKEAELIQEQRAKEAAERNKALRKTIENEYHEQSQLSVPASLFDRLNTVLRKSSTTVSDQIKELQGARYLAPIPHGVTEEDEGQPPLKKPTLQAVSGPERDSSQLSLSAAGRSDRLQLQTSLPSPAEVAPSTMNDNHDKATAPRRITRSQAVKDPGFYRILLANPLPETYGNSARSLDRSTYDVQPCYSSARSLDQSTCDDAIDIPVLCIAPSSVYVLTVHVISEGIEESENYDFRHLLPEEQEDTVELRYKDGILQPVRKPAPETFREAVNRPTEEGWKEAIERELNSFEEHNTFEICNLPKGMEVMDSRWLFLNKSTGLAKARLVQDIYIIIVLYVDDMLIMGTSESEVVKTKDMLSKEVEITFQTNVKRFLGMSIDILKDKINVSLKDYISESFNDIKPNEKVKTPCSTAWKDHLLPTPDDELIEDPGEYRLLVGKLLFASTTVRYDIAFAVAVLSRYMAKPTKRQYAACVRVVQYLKSTEDFCLTYHKQTETNDINLEFFTDADWGGCPSDSKSISGFIARINDSPIYWRARGQKSVSQSTHEAEAIALSDTNKEAIWMKDLLVNSGDWNQQHETTIYSDNESLIKALARTDYYVSARTKHLRVDLAAIREGVKYENFIIKHMVFILKLN
ncbi:hypothetical protein C7M61_003243 [Candidozyma pseudohaemuli]|uniref:Integrase catalytic domain-containing protein n=1 Tax=Candidozyma pseudohaemuli TaxID=418784 RepID=A0A2P7YNK9_9ASCO|nr:hypothetical protein C7M61_003243 [[Candida] pseudohaemulonii]PSK37539.1 hypothetical protein C7M61_003243 [[Candida] pseudohaemulonii]